MKKNNCVILKYISFVLLLHTINSVVAQESDLKSTNRISVTKLKFNTDTNKLQFAIVSDLWGGYRKGVFEDAVEKVELLQPQFVISVGDLINGQTYNTKEAHNQWLEFNERIKPLSMPFFYVPGNHDIGNPLLETVWKKELGNPYYYFIQKDVLFLCLNTEDGGKPGIQKEQIAFFKKAIKDNQNVRWTFIFMHRPVWFTDNNNQEGYEQIEEALKDRNYTLFSGHHHTYLQVLKNGNKHFVLGSTGGGSDMRGEKYGEFDHITMVSLNKDEQPKIVNLKLDGIIKDDVVNEKTYPLTNVLIEGNWLITPSYVAQHRFEKEVLATVLFDNPTPYPLKVSGFLPGNNEYTVFPEKLDLSIPAQTKKQQEITIQAKGKPELDLSKLPFLNINLNGEYTRENVNYEIPTSKRLLLDWKHVITDTKQAKSIIEKQFKDADTTGMIALKEPEYLKNKWYWSGTKDLLIQFKLMRNSKYLFLLAFIKDDQLVISNKEERDKIFIHFENKDGSPEKFVVFPNKTKSFIKAENETSIITINKLDLNTDINNEGFVKLMLKIPLDKVLKIDNSIRFNIGYHDLDSIPQKQFSDVFWKPIWNTPLNYDNSGTFLLN